MKKSAITLYTYYGFVYQKYRINIWGRTVLKKNVL